MPGGATNQPRSDANRAKRFQPDFGGDGSAFAVTDDRLGAPVNFKNIRQGSKVPPFDFVDRDGVNHKFQLELTNIYTAKPSGWAAQRIQGVGHPGQQIAETRRPAKET